MKRLVVTILCACALSGCTTLLPVPAATEHNPAATAHNALDAAPAGSGSGPSIPLFERLAWPQTVSQLTDASDERLYAFSADAIPIRKALELFSTAYGLNMVVDADVTGTVTVDFRDLPFGQAMSALLDTHGYYFEMSSDLVLVKSTETRTFTVDYIRLVRSGSGSSQAQVNTGSDDSSGGSGGDSETAAGTITIEQKDNVSFWDELEAQLAALVSESGRLVVNRLAGLVQVTDQHRRVKEVARFVDQLNRSIYRQVDIEVKIVEVALNDDSSLGIDWSRFMSGNGVGRRNVDFNLDNIVQNPAGGLDALAPVLGAVFSDISESGENRLTAMISALEEQGEVQVVSQPRIRTLNNQSALIKVGTDRTFFRREQLTDSTSAGSQIFSTDIPQVVTEGVVLAITPQVSIDGWITMDVSPVVTRVSSVSEVADDRGNIVSSAPNLDISQSSSLVRARSGETIVIGGLIQDLSSETDRGVTGLNKVPGLGRLFRGNYKAEQKRELVMFVTPRLVSDVSAVRHESQALIGGGE